MGLPVAGVMLPAVTTTTHAGLSVTKIGGGLLHSVVHMIPWQLVKGLGGLLAFLAVAVVFRTWRYLRKGPVRTR